MQVKLSMFQKYCILWATEEKYILVKQHFTHKIIIITLKRESFLNLGTIGKIHTGCQMDVNQWLKIVRVFPAAVLKSTDQILKFHTICTNDKIVFKFIRLARWKIIVHSIYLEKYLAVIICKTNAAFLTVSFKLYTCITLLYAI